VDELIVEDPRGYIASRIVCSAIFFFKGGADVDRRLQTYGAFMDFAEHFQSELTHHQYPGSGSRPRKIDWEKIRSEGVEKILTLGPDEALDTAVFGQPFDPKSGGISLFGGSITAAKPDELMPIDLSILELSVAPSWAVGDSFEDFYSLVADIAKKIKPEHGLAGFNVQYDRIYASTSSQAYSFPFIKRFPGAHCGLDLTFLSEINARRLSSAKIFSTNWLNFLGTELAMQIGGVEELRTQIGSSCPIEEYEGGIVIRAGDYPQLGDINRGLVLDDYRRVASALKPIRFEDYGVGLLDVEEPLDSLEETLKWIRRFD
jgi:hypothetical protein